MKWQGREQSSNIEDRRGQGGGGLGGGGGFGGGFGNNPLGGGGGFQIPVGRGGAGGIGIIILFVIIAMVFGVNPLTLLNGVTTDQTTTSSNSLPPQNATADDLRSFVGVIVKDTENYWGNYFQTTLHTTYTPPKVVLFSNQTNSACGAAESSSGPFYCPDDQKVYVDLAFYDQLRQQFGAPGDFAQAYVIAHEVGHHIQNLVGTLPKFNQARQNMSQDQANAYSVRVELQADCYAGAWGKSEFEQGFLDSGDAEEAINAANQIGDDTLTKGSVSPRQYTHGTSAQRMKWFKQGYNTGDPAQCDTFGGNP